MAYLKICIKYLTMKYLLCFYILYNVKSEIHFKEKKTFFQYLFLNVPSSKKVIDYKCLIHSYVVQLLINSFFHLS